MEHHNKKLLHTQLTEGSPLRGVLLFAIPLFVGQLFQIFYGLVDVRIVGEILGSDSLAAVGATSTLSDLLVGLMNGFTNGLAIVIATFYGARDDKNIHRTMAGTILLGGAGAASISVLSLLFLQPLLDFLHVDPEIRGEAVQYISIILAGLICATAYNVCAAILRAMGDSFTPLLFLIFSSFLNIGLDYLFIGGLSLGVAGAALATVVSQLLSALLCFLYMRRKYPMVVLHREDFQIPGDLYRRLLASGLSMAFMVSFVQFGTLALQTSINALGNQIIVAHTAARKVTSIYMLPHAVLGTALATFCGQNLGAGKPGRIREGIFKSVALAWGWCLVVILLTYTIAPKLISFITASTDHVMIDTAVRYLRFDTLFYFITVVICIFRNSMQGLGDTKTPVLSSGIELVGKVLVVLFLTPRLGYDGVILAEPMVWAVMVIPLIVGLLRHPVMRKDT